MSNTILRAEIVEQDIILSIRELAHACAVEEEYLLALVAEGIIEPDDYTEWSQQPDKWQFSGDTIGLIKLSLRLQKDLAINLAGIASIIEILNEQ